MKVIFLDVDGVLNCASTVERRKGCIFVEDRKIRLLEQIVKTSQSEIVLSSTWRLLPDDMKALADKLSEFNLSIHSTTQHLNNTRGIEIQCWLLQHPEVDSFIVLDDDDDMGSLSNHLVKTTWENGLQPEHVAQALSILNKGDEHYD